MSPISRRTWLTLPAGLATAGLISPRRASADGWWAQTTSSADFWSGSNSAAVSFGQLPKGTYVYVPLEQPEPGAPRLLVQEAAEHAYGYVEPALIKPSDPPPPGVSSAAPPAAAVLFTPFWVANHTASWLWSTPNADAATLSELPPFSKLLVLAPASGLRYYVQNARTEQLGYVDSALVGPSDPPEPADLGTPPPPPAPAFRPWWVTAFRRTTLWSAVEGGESFGPVAPGDHLLVMVPQSGPRLHVLNPKTKGLAFVDAAAVGPSGGPAPATLEVSGWTGVVAADVVNLRPEPHTFIAPQGQARAGDRVKVSAWVEGEELDKDNRTWARLSQLLRRNEQGTFAEVPPAQEGTARYIFASLLQPVAVTRPPDPPATTLGSGGARWIDVNLSQQVVSAYEGSKLVYFAPATSGRPGWETPTGVFRIQRRVASETMLGSTLLRLDTLEVPDYRLEHVKWTQYFTAGGAALHTNYWRPASIFAMPSSHGCVGLQEQHAQFFWSWAGIGTPLLIHV